MPFVIAGELAVHYRLDGPAAAPVVLFANSLGTGLTIWDAQVAALAGAYRCLRYDMRGHGLTELGRRADVDVALLAADAVALLDALGIERVAVVGLSIGGIVAQQLAATAPERVRALVLCATAMQIGPPSVWEARIATIEREGMAGLVEGVLQRWFTPATHAARPELIRGLATMLLRTPAAGYAACCRALRDADLRAADARIAAPALVVAGSEDPVTTPAMGAAMQATIPGAEMTTIAGAAHIIPLEAPDAFDAAVTAFLERTAPVGARA